MQKFYTKKQVSESLGVCTKTIERWVRQGKLKGALFGNTWRFSTEDIENLYKKMQEETGDKIESKKKTFKLWKNHKS